MGFGIRCGDWLRRNTFAASILLFGIANTFAQIAIAEDVKPVQTVVVRAGRLFDPVAGRMLYRPVIVIVGNKIHSVSNGNPPSTSGATLIDLGDANSPDVRCGWRRLRRLRYLFTPCSTHRCQERTPQSASRIHHGAQCGCGRVLGRGSPRRHQRRRRDRTPHAGVRSSPWHYWRTLR